MGQVFTAIRAAVYASGFVLLSAWLAVELRPMDARLDIRLPRWSVPLGVVIAALGAALALQCVAVFVRVGRGTPAPFDPPREFVAVGPYRYVRNPMYVGGLSAILGCGLALRSPSVTALAFAFLGVMHLFVVLYEEPVLERRFGASYRRYRARVPRWWPSRPGEDLRT